MQYDILTKPVFAGLDKILIADVKKMSDHPWFVPKGIQHRPKAPLGATVLMVEQNSIVPTGS